MEIYDEQLQKFQEQVARKNRLEAELDDLYVQQEKLEEKVSYLEIDKINEQEDVERLERRSLASFFYNVIGKMDEKLTKEREEAYAASVNFDAAFAEWEAVKIDIERREAELKSLSHCEERYEKALHDKTEAIRKSGIPEASAILEMEKRISALEIQQKEIREALESGETAQQIAEGVKQSLESAEGWSTFDLFGGGLVADIVKHDHLDKAQMQVEDLQVALRRFKTELADVTIRANLQVNIDGFLRFADYFFDGLFADWAVMEKIGKAKVQIEKTLSDICLVNERLERMFYDAEDEKERLIVQWELKVKNIKLPQ